MIDLYELRCKEPWHTDPEYADGGNPHYGDCFVPVDEPLYRKEASNASDHDHVCDDMNGCFRLERVNGADTP